MYAQEGIDNFPDNFIERTNVRAMQHDNMRPYTFKFSKQRVQMYATLEPAEEHNLPREVRRDARCTGDEGASMQPVPQQQPLVRLYDQPLDQAARFR